MVTWIVAVKREVSLSEERDKSWCGFRDWGGSAIAILSPKHGMVSGVDFFVLFC